MSTQRLFNLFVCIMINPSIYNNSQVNNALDKQQQLCARMSFLVLRYHIFFKKLSYFSWMHISTVFRVNLIELNRHFLQDTIISLFIVLRLMLVINQNQIGMLSRLLRSNSFNYIVYWRNNVSPLQLTYSYNQNNVHMTENVQLGLTFGNLNHIELPHQPAVGGNTFQARTLSRNPPVTGVAGH